MLESTNGRQLSHLSDKSAVQRFRTMIRKHIGSRRVFGVQDKLVECVLGDGLPIYRNSTSYTLSELKNKGNRNYEGVEGDHLGQHNKIREGNAP